MATSDHAIETQVVKVVIPANMLDDKTVFHLNPSGRFIIGGPQVRVLPCLLIILLVGFFGLTYERFTINK